MGETVLFLRVVRRKPPMVIGTFLVPYQEKHVPYRVFPAVCPRIFHVFVALALRISGREHIVDVALVPRVSLQVVVGVPFVGSPTVPIPHVEPAIVLLVVHVLEYVIVAIVALAFAALKSPVRRQQHAEHR